MAKQEKTELAVIDFTKFSVAQLPELKGKKEEIASIIKANPIVEIVDNATYESAKKSRTAVRSLRTSLEGEQKAVKKKIKEHVLDVVDKEYDTLVLDVKSEEKSRQEPIDVWEEKKEQERQEKARLEQERIDGIKSTISLFKQGWEIKISELTFEGIDTLIEDLNITDSEFDRVSLQEFEVLFDDAISLLKNTLDMKINTLREQEQIRIDNLVIEEKNAENRKIQSWQNTWNTNISSLVFDDISDVKKSFRQSKLEFLKHYTTEYDEIYSSTEKRLHSQIEFISKAEEQRIAKEKFDKEQKEISKKNRIAQDKFLAEKKEFEEKQANAKFQERKNIVYDEGYWNLFFDMECNNQEDIAKTKLLAYSDEEFQNFVKAIIEARTPKEELIPKYGAGSPVFGIEYVDPKDVLPSNTTDKVEEIANFDAFTFSEEVVFEDVSQKSVDSSQDFMPSEQIAEFDLPKEVTWGSIYKEWETHNHPQKEQSVTWLIWLETHYNVPTKKQ